MAKGYIRNETCSFKVGIYQNRDGNILQDGETIAGQKNFTFGGFASLMTPHIFSRNFDGGYCRECENNFGFVKNF